jgi:hypothetical protein
MPYNFYLKLLTMMFDGFQIDIQALITFDTSGTGQTGYKHIYNVRNNIVSNDQDRTSDQNIYNPCDSNPCKNNGSCSIGFNNSLICLCPSNYNGYLLTLKTIKVNITISIIKQVLFVKLPMFLLSHLDYRASIVTTCTLRVFMIIHVIHHLASIMVYASQKFQVATFACADLDSKVKNKLREFVL